MRLNYIQTSIHIYVGKLYLPPPFSLPPGIPAAGFSMVHRFANHLPFNLLEQIFTENFLGAQQKRVCPLDSAKVCGFEFRYC